MLDSKRGKPPPADPALPPPAVELLLPVSTCLLLVEGPGSIPISSSLTRRTGRSTGRRDVLGLLGRELRALPLRVIRSDDEDEPVRKEALRMLAEGDALLEVREFTNVFAEEDRPLIRTEDVRLLLLLLLLLLLPSPPLLLLHPPGPRLESIGWRQLGQVALTMSQWSMQPTWNWCLHGNSLVESPASKDPRQMAQLGASASSCSASAAPPARGGGWYSTTGMESMSFQSAPLPAMGSCRVFMSRTKHGRQKQNTGTSARATRHGRQICRYCALRFTTQAQ